MKVLAIVAGILVALAVSVLTIFTLGMRTKSPTVLNAIRRMNRAFVNPRQHDAGTPGANASLIQHCGRTTGRLYETPVVAEVTEDGFVIALPYGMRADWLKNVLASGSATVIHEGSVHQVGAPELVPIDDADVYFSPNERRAHRVFGTDRCLRLHRVHTTSAR
jgi:deazaflavin-dependent oxidoreductase (nitroreductase family)